LRVSKIESVDGTVARPGGARSVRAPKPFAKCINCGARRQFTSSLCSCGESRYRLVTEPHEAARAVAEAAQLAEAVTAEVRITDPTTGGQKGQKIERFDLIPFEFLIALATVYGLGAQKYDPDNWRKGYSWRLSLGAMMRHIALWVIGQSYDTETKQHHLAHAAWHCATLFVFETQKLGTDDRAKWMST
jgi:Domain of unknown function (DUF5664)